MHTSALSAISHTYPTVRLSAKMAGSHAKVQFILELDRISPLLLEENETVLDY